MEQPTIRILPLAEQDIPELVQLARSIWYAHYPSIISVEQIEYMLGQRYHPDVIRDQLRAEGVWWDKLLRDGEMVAFASYELGKHAGDNQPGEMKIDKLYVRYDLRGQGLGGRLLRQIEQQARRRGCNRIWLQVNKNNISAIESYKRSGLQIAESVKVDIGGGFAMDDYIMAKACA